jgi:hypothetical protein
MEAGNGTDFSLQYPSSSFGGFVPRDSAFAAGLSFSFRQCHTPGAICGHESYLELVPQIMAQTDHAPDSWAAVMEEQLKAHFEVVDAALTVEQIHCGDAGCLVELTQDKTGGTYVEETAVFKAARTALTGESWLKDEFFASYEESPFTGVAQYWGNPSDKFEELWIFARRAQGK